MLTSFRRRGKTPVLTIGYRVLHRTPEVGFNDAPAGDDYPEGLEWLYERQALGIEPGLARVEALLAAIGNPHHSFQSVHVAGTNGKGSVAAMLSNALRLSGHRTGLYTSPHLVSFRERIQIDGAPIGRSKTSRLIQSMRTATSDLEREGMSPTFFEICTAMAFTHFADRDVSWAIVEAGMGGRLDATNVIRPSLAVVTNVSRDHTTFLGDDLRAIALEKAGIAKPGIPLVTAAEGEVLEVITEQVRRQGGTTVAIGDQYRVDPDSDDLRISDRGRQRQFAVGMAGAHQVRNAAVVVAACDQLTALGADIDPDAVRQALAKTAVPARLERIERDGIEVVIDGAHNLAATEAITAHLAGREYDLVVGFSRDKEWVEMLRRLATLAHRVWGVPIRSPRSLDPVEMAEVLPERIPFETVPDFDEAWWRLRESGSERVLVTGSLFLAGEAKAILTDGDLSEVGGSQ